VLVVVVLVAYLTGRESGRRAAEEASPAPSHTTAVAGESPVSAAPTLEDSSGQKLAPAEPAEDFPSTDYQPPFPAFEDDLQETEPTGWADAADPAGGASPGQAEVAAYFVQIEAYEQQAKYWGNPQEFAMALIGQGAKGNTRGFEQLIETHRDAQEQIESMTVPLPCQEHHRRTLALLSQALRLLEGLQRGVVSGNVGGLATLSGNARQLEAQAREVDALAADLKSRFGL
jgi:hypothetical protein